jgi:polyhydroxyalkanoate synthase
VNSPTTNRRSYWASDAALSKKSALPKQAGDWLEAAQEHAGSWWSDWYVWLEAQQARLNKKQVKAPKTLGNKTYKVLRDAPGEYVRARAM